MRTEAEIEAAYRTLGEWRSKNDPDFEDEGAETVWSILRFVLGYEYEDRTPQGFIGEEMGFEDLDDED